jgi:uncharacterized membrane protein YebE (DUF533 family)
VSFMSLLGTLAKVAIGVAVAKGVGSMMKGAGSGGGILGNAPQQAPSGGQGGLGDLLGQVLGGGQQSGSGGGIGGKGGLGDLLEGLTGGVGGSQSSTGQTGGMGGLGDILGQLTKGAQGGGAGGLGDILGQLTGKTAQQSGQSQQGGGGSFGDILNDALRGGGEPKVQPTTDQEAVAALMLSAMIQAAKCDGNLDDGERKKLLSNMKDATREEMAFVNHELESPVDVDGLVRQVPRGLEPQVYTMSVMAINLDNKNEALYLDKLAKGLGIYQRQADAIHDHLGVPKLYS